MRVELRPVTIRRERIQNYKKPAFAGQIVGNNGFFKRLSKDPSDLIPVKTYGIGKVKEKVRRVRIETKNLKNGRVKKEKNLSSKQTPTPSQTHFSIIKKFFLPL